MHFRALRVNAIPGGGRHFGFPPPGRKLPNTRKPFCRCSAQAISRYGKNGIIENAAALKTRLLADGAVFHSETDTGVVAHLILAMPADTLVEAWPQALRLVYAPLPL